MLEREIPSLQKYIVEVGAGKSPIARERAMRSGERYVAVDLYENKEAQAVKALLDIIHEDAPGAARVITADGTNLPFGQESVDELIFSNVFGDSRLHDDRLLFIQEARRVIKKGGKVTVVETYSPDITSVEELRKLMRGEGLHQVNEGQERDKVALEEYNKEVNPISSYLATFVPLQAV